MIKRYKDLIIEDYVLCFPKEVKIDMLLVGTYRCCLKVPCNEILLNAIYAEPFLRKGYNTTDPNGTLLTLLDSDLDKKLVIIGELNLYFALQQDSLLDSDNVLVEILDEFPRSKKWSF